MTDDDFAEGPEASSLESTTGPRGGKLGVGRLVAAAGYALVGLSSLMQALGAGAQGNLVVALPSITVACLMGFVSWRVMKRRVGTGGVIGLWLLLFVGLSYWGSILPMIAVGFLTNDYSMLFRQIGPLALGQIGGVGVIWFMSRRIERTGLRLVLRALALSVAFTPFIPHAGVQWSSGWPPAVYWLVLGIRTGDLPLFELATILSFAVVIWLASLAVHHDFARQNAVAEEVAAGTPGSRPGDAEAVSDMPRSGEEDMLPSTREASPVASRKAGPGTSAGPHTRTGPDIKKAVLGIVIVGIAALVVGRALGFLQIRSDDREPKVVTAAFSPSGDRILTAGWDGTAKLWNAETGDQLLSLEGHRDSVAHASFSHDGDRVVTASFDGTARIWDAYTGELLHRLEGHRGKVMEAWFSPDGERVLTAAGMQGYLWDARSGQRIAELDDHTSLVGSARFSPDAELALTRSWDATARVWNGSDGTPRAVLTHEWSVDFALFSPTGDRILTGDSVSRTSRLWGTNGEELVTLGAPGGGYFDHASFSPDGSRIATVGIAEAVMVWDSVTGEALLTLESPGSDPDYLAYSPDGSHVVVGKSDATTRIWDAATGNQSAVLDSKGTRGVHGSFSPDASRVVVAYWDGTARVWDVAGGDALLVLVHEQARPSQS